jgi:nitroimidazol reductase NimA-like FMN-containing flavoprotein (pyridoxamine 5'-phosphate oxidase superfamily)
MTTQNDNGAGFRFRELSTTECLMLLKSTGVGRVGWCGDGGPRVLPVNYVVDNGRILFRTSPYSVIAKIAAGQQVAFEVDNIDEFLEIGWSVLVVGAATGVGDPGDIPKALQDRPAPWAPGNRTLYIRIQPDTVTGRRVVGD